MRGSGLKRFDPQAGSGFFKDMLYDAALAGARGIRKDWRKPRKAIRTATANAKRSVKNSLKRKAKEVAHRSAKRLMRDIFDPPVGVLNTIP